MQQLRNMDIDFLDSYLRRLLVSEIDTVCGFVCRLLDRFVDGMKFNVEFTVNRLTLRVQHRAAELAATYRLGEVLFPAAPAFPSQQTELPNLRLGTLVYRLYSHVFV